MSHWLHAGPSEYYHSRNLKRYYEVSPSEEELNEIEEENKKENELDCDNDDLEEPQPRGLTPAPEPRISPPCYQSKGINLTTSPPSNQIKKEEKRKEREEAAAAAAFFTKPFSDWPTLRELEQQKKMSLTHLQQLDLSSVEMNSTQWSWLCQDVLPLMINISSLKLARMGITDRQLGELFRGCNVGGSFNRRQNKDKTSRRLTTPVVSENFNNLSCMNSRIPVSRGLPRSSSVSSSIRGNTKEFTMKNVTSIDIEERSTLCKLRVLDLTGNYLTYRSATPIGKLLLWASDTLEELHLLGNPLQDYGFQILGIYLAKLQLISLKREPHLFPPKIVQQYLNLIKQERKASQDERIHYTMMKGSSIAIVNKSNNISDNKELNNNKNNNNVNSQIHLGISFLDLRDCQSSARGISHLLAGASRAHRLSTVLLARNSAIPSSLLSPKPLNTDIVLLSYPDGNSSNTTTTINNNNNTGLENKDDNSIETNLSLNIYKFSNFEELYYPCALKTINLCGVPLSKLCTPIGCRELFLNLFFCCPNLILLDLSESFNIIQVPPSLLLQILLEEYKLPNDPRKRWRLEQEIQGEIEFTLETVEIGRQACVGNILCELIAHAAFNALRRNILSPPAFCYLQELHLNSTGITDRGAKGLAVAVSSSASTGIFSNLVVLNMSDNILTLKGCTQIINAFIINWPNSPSILSALALQGNAGIHHDDIYSITTLKQIAEEAVQKRQNEYQSWITNDKEIEEKFPLLPLSIHLGAAGSPAFIISSDTKTVFSIPTKRHTKLNEKTKKNEEVNNNYNDENDENDDEEEEECFPTFRFKQTGTTPFLKHTSKPFVEVPASNSFQSPIITSSPLAAATNTTEEENESEEIYLAKHNTKTMMPTSIPFDMSSIHTRDTPARFLYSVPETPSFLNSIMHPLVSPDTTKSPRQSQQQSLQVQLQLEEKETEKEAEIIIKRKNKKKEEERGRRLKEAPPLVSPTLETSPRPDSNININTKPNIIVGSPNFNINIDPSSPVTREGHWALSIANTRARSQNQNQNQNLSNCVNNNLPLSQLTQKEEIKQDVIEDVWSQSKREKKKKQQEASSIAFEFGCLFANMDDKRSYNEYNDKEEKEEKNMVHNNNNNNNAISHHDEEEEILRRGTSSNNEIPSSFPEEKEGKNLLLVEPFASSSITSEISDNDISKKRQKKKNTKGQYRLQKQQLSKYLDSEELPKLSEETRINYNIVTEVITKDEKEEEEKIQPLILDEINPNDNNNNNNNNKENIITEILLNEKEKENPTTTSNAIIPLNQVKSKRVRSFTLSYYHPKGHLLCRGWHLLHRNDPTGANARASLERDIWTFLQPEISQEKQKEKEKEREENDCIVVNSVSIVIDFSSQTEKHNNTEINNNGAAECGITKLQITSNERRSILAARLQKHANMDLDGTIAFPRFTKALKEAGDDTVETVSVLLEAMQEIILPLTYAGASAEEIVHARHGSEDTLIEELSTILEKAINNNNNVEDISIKENFQSANYEEENEKEQEEVKEKKQEEEDENLKENEPKENNEIADASEFNSIIVDEVLSFQATKLEEQEENKNENNLVLIDGEESPPWGPNAPTQSPVVKITTKATPELIEEKRLIKSTSNVTISKIDNKTLTSHPSSINSSTPIPISLPPPHHHPAVVVSNITPNLTNKISIEEISQLQPSRNIAHRMKTFVFSFPHREGHLLCRGWRLLHQNDVTGVKARQELEYDILSLLQSPSHEGQIVESVSFAWEGSSSTMQLRVVTNERRATISERLQCSTEYEEESKLEIMFPRFTKFLRSNPTFDTIYIVENFLQQQTSGEIKARVASRYRSISTLIHYYHSDEAAMLREIGAKNMMEIEEAIIMNSNDDKMKNIKEISSLPSVLVSVQPHENENKFNNEKVNKEENIIVDEINDKLLISEPVENTIKDNKNQEKEEEKLKQESSQKKEELQVHSVVESLEGVIENTPHSHISSPNVKPSTPVVHSNHICSSTANFIVTEESNGSRTISRNGNENCSEINEINIPIPPNDRIFAERLRRLQILAYSAVLHGAMLLDKQQRHKFRICKGKWGKQSVTIAVEWDVFLIIYFVKNSPFGVTSRKHLVLVHPIACGVQCWMEGSEHMVRGNSKDIIIRLERSYSPEELGISSLDIERKLQESLPASVRTSISSRRSRTPQQTPRSTSNSNINNNNVNNNSNSNMMMHNNNNINNSSLLLNSSSSLTSVDSMALTPGLPQLLQRTVLIRVTLNSLSRARETITSIRSAEQRAVNMIRKTITEQSRQAMQRPLPVMPTT